MDAISAVSQYQIRGFMLLGFSDMADMLDYLCSQGI